MTRREAYVNYGMDVLSINDRIDKIYDDFESRTCENCEHYMSVGLSCHNKKNEIAYWSSEEIPKDFGCNKFERIDHD